MRLLSVLASDKDGTATAELQRRSGCALVPVVGLLTGVTTGADPIGLTNHSLGTAWAQSGSQRQSSSPRGCSSLVVASRLNAELGWILSSAQVGLGRI